MFVVDIITRRGNAKKQRKTCASTSACRFAKNAARDVLQHSQGAVVNDWLVMHHAIVVRRLGFFSLGRQLDPRDSPYTCRWFGKEVPQKRNVRSRKPAKDLDALRQCRATSDVPGFVAWSLAV